MFLRFGCLVVCCFVCCGGICWFWFCCLFVLFVVLAVCLFCVWTLRFCGVTDLCWLCTAQGCAFGLGCLFSFIAYFGLFTLTVV